VASPVTFFNRQQLSTVRSQIELVGVVTVGGLWQDNFARADILAGSSGGAAGERLVVLSLDALHALLETGQRSIAAA
jgi:hypothetical protein